jgi:hypothetical protein
METVEYLGSHFVYWLFYLILATGVFWVVGQITYNFKYNPNRLLRFLYWISSSTPSAVVWLSLLGLEMICVAVIALAIKWWFGITVVGIYTFFIRMAIRDSMKSNGKLPKITVLNPLPETKELCLLYDEKRKQYRLPDGGSNEQQR